MYNTADGGRQDKVYIMHQTDKCPAQYAAIIAALTVATSSATYYHVNIDDVLAVARPFAYKK
ncbi:hypothetical protein, partial [Vibrio parahaemolyticus]